MAYVPMDTIHSAHMDEFRVPELVMDLKYYPTSMIHAFTDKNPEELIELIAGAVPPCYKKETKPERGLVRFIYDSSEDYDFSVKFVVRFSTHDDVSRPKYLMEIERNYGDAFAFADVVSSIRKALEGIVEFEPLLSFNSSRR